MKLYPNERTAVFIDGVHTFNCLRSLGWQMDYARLLTYFADRAMLVRPYYFTALKDDDDTVRHLTEWLNFNGYTVITKPLVAVIAATTTWRGYMEVEMAVTMMKLAPSIDHAVLFAGKGDLRAAVEAVQEMGVRVTIVSSEPSELLRRQADEVVALASLRDVMARNGQ